MTDERDLWGPGPEDLVMPTAEEVEMALSSVVDVGHRRIRRRRIVTAAGSVAVVALFAAVIPSLLPNNKKISPATQDTSTTSTFQIGIGNTTSSTVAPTKPPARLIIAQGQGNDAQLISVEPTTGKTKSVIARMGDLNGFTTGCSADQTIESPVIRRIQTTSSPTNFFVLAKPTCAGGANGGTVFNIDTKAKTATSVAEGANDFALSPDGDHIIFDSYNSTASNSDVIVRSISTGASRTIDHTTGPADFAWSPDGTLVAEDSYKSDNDRQVAILHPFDDAPTRQIIPQPTVAKQTFVDSFPRFVNNTQIFLIRDTRQTGTPVKTIAEAIGVYDVTTGTEVQQVATGDLNRDHYSTSVDIASGSFLFISGAPGPNGNTGGDLRVCVNGKASVVLDKDVTGATF